MVKRLMTKLFTMKMLSGYSRAGGCKSRKFSELKIYEVIFGKNWLHYIMYEKISILY